MNQREKIIAGLAGIVALGFGGYAYGIDPWLTARTKLIKDIETAQKAVADGDLKVEQEKQARKRFEAMRTAGLAGKAADAETFIQTELAAAARQFQLPNPGLNSSRASGGMGLREVQYRVNADNGRMANVAPFLFSLSNAKGPLRIKELKLTSQLDGADDLQIDVQVSTVWEDPTVQDTRRGTRGRTTRP